jgi:hypothetical protein
LQLPFAEDVRALTFPSLTHLVNRKGKVVTEHPTIPTQAQTDAMDDFVDAMDLVDPTSTEDNSRSFFDVNESYSPAIHNIQNTLLFRMANGEGELPPPPEVLTRFMRPPREVVERAKGARERLKETMGVKYGKSSESAPGCATGRADRVSTCPQCRPRPKTFASRPQRE